ncbi:hypothetical protein [Ekhidna sp.]|uniref:hypothetical protein n=1 Tax=Ekhidna sp. TaxID=2608089 RepID=UPI0032EAEA9D
MVFPLRAEIPDKVTTDVTFLSVFDPTAKQNLKNMETTVKNVFSLLKYTYGLVPIVAGLDKFTNILTDWSQYLSEGMIPMEAGTFMMIVGVIEIIAGALVLTKTKLGSLIVAAWLILIAITLLISWSYVDVAVRDLVMAIGAYSLYKLSDHA